MPAPVLGRSVRAWRSTLVVAAIAAGFFSCLHTFAAQTAADSLVGYWKFDETAAGATAVDSSGDGNGGTPDGTGGANNKPQPTSTVPTLNFSDGRSLNFDGTDDYLSVATNSGVDLVGTDMTVGAWIYMAGGAGTYRIILSKKTASDNSPTYEFGIGDSDKIYWYQTTGTPLQARSTTSPSLGAWHHVAFVFVNSSKTGTFYLDGVADGTASSLDAMATTSAPLYIGTDGPSGVGENNYFNGNIDDLRLYARALSAREIAELAAGNHPTAYWNGNYGTGFERARNWSGSFVPDPFTRVVVRASTGSLTLTGAVKVAALTINSGAVFKLYGSNLTVQDAGTVTPYGTLAMLNSETLSGFTLPSNKGTVLLYGTGSTTGLPANTLHNLTLNDGLVAYWTFDEASGTRIADFSGFGNSGSLINGAVTSTSTVAPVHFQDDRSLSLDGVDDYVNFTPIVSNLPRGTMPRTISVWVRPGDASIQTLLDYGTDAGGRRITLSASSLEVSVAVNGHRYGKTGFSLSGWHHIAYVFPRGATQSNKWLIYVDGVQQTLSTLNGSTQTINTGNTYAYVGRNTPSTGHYTGNVDEFRIYNRALLPGEIASLAAGNVPSTSLGMVTLNSALDVNGDLTINGGTLDVSASSITVGGSFLNAGGIFTPRKGTVTFDGTSSSLRILSGGQRFNRVTLNGANATWTLQDRLVASGALTLTSGTLDANASGNFTIRANSITQTDGTFQARAGILVLTASSNKTLTIGNTLSILQIEDPTENGLIGYWKFDEGTNTGAIIDSSGYGNTGERHGSGALVWTGTTLPSLAFENPSAMHFASGRDYVRVASSATLPTSNLTICTWLKTTMSTTGHIAEQGRNPSNFNNEYVLRMYGGSVVFWDFGTTDYGFHEDWTNTTPVNDGQWHHVCFVKNVLSGTYYLDGTVDGTRTADTDVTYVSDDFIIGRDYRDDTAQFVGDLDDLRIYNRSLTASEIRNLYAGHYADGANGTAIVTLDGNLDLSTMTILSGVVTAGSRSMTVSGDWNNDAGTGAFVAGSSTVRLDGAATQNVRGSTNFANFRISTDAAQTVNFGSGTTQGVASSLVLQGGGSSNRLSLAPLSAGYSWYLALGNAATQVINYVEPSYSNASNGLTILANDGTSIDADHNSNWRFIGASDDSSNTAGGGGGGGSGGGGFRGVTGPGGSTDVSRVQQARLAILERFGKQMQNIVEQTAPSPSAKPVITQRLPDTVAKEDTQTSSGDDLLRIGQLRGRLVAQVEDAQVLYRDVLISEWYAPYVASLIETGVAEGYRDEGGTLRGEFGVANPITRAEVLKMALDAAQVTYDVKPPRNPSAQGSWASSYVAKAEDMGLTVFSPAADVNAPATRGEVMQILLEVMDLPIGKRPSSFLDVPADHPYSQAIAVMEFYDIVQGDTDASGTALHTFRPDTHINRAEVAKIIALLQKILE